MPQTNQGAPVVGERAPYSPEIHTLHQHLDPIIYRVLDEFSHAQGFPPYALVAIKDFNMETLSAWQITTDVREADPTKLHDTMQFRIDLAVDSKEKMFLNVRYWGLTNEQLSPLLKTLATETNLPVRVHEVPPTDPLWQEMAKAHG